MGDRVRALALRDLDQQLRDERPRERRGQGIDALVLRVGLEAGEHELAHEAVAPVHHVRLAGTGRDGPLGDPLAQRAATDVHGQGHDLGVVLLAQPGDGDRCVQTARVGEHDLLHELGTSDGRERCLGRSGPAAHSRMMATSADT